ncbi:endonuclease/exonuclease/phosphatase family protein [Rubrivivax rivuli]|uniref:Endonuclease/exonuclease/phosphatase family protein n=1 Tax=Rubrivivax rivuli TaxID=1862385 RepID=A0A437RAH4_9BURK|nr:endonuclease/exonuclease/phosphatase family protein [Rubrivivax rivuli]
MSGSSGLRLKTWAVVLLGLCLGWAVQAQPFNAATYNLRFNTASDGPNAWPHRRDAVKALVRHHEIDLLGTQEGLIDQIEDLEALPGLARVGVGRDDGRRAGEHSALFFRTERFALLANGDFWLSPTPEVPGKGWDARCCHRLATWARLRDRANGRVFVAFSVHFDHEGVVARRESARLMLRKMREIAGDAPALLLGDLNATPESEPVQILLTGLRDARNLSATPPEGPVGTFNGFKPDAPLLARIDYVLLSPQWRVLRYAALADRVEGRFPSDHLPVVTRLSLE